MNNEPAIPLTAADDPTLRSRYRARDRWQRQHATRMVVAREEDRLENAARLKEKGVDMDTIVYATGLSAEEVEAL